MNEPSNAHQAPKAHAVKERILFVDDEPEILDGLRRSMRSMRDEWEMEFARSGDEALAMLSAKRFDVVVADLWMPKMDGMQLLTRVAEMYPNVSRVVLTGAVDRETAANGRKVAQDYLVKPCSGEMLSSIIKVRIGIERLKRESAAHTPEPIPPPWAKPAVARAAIDVNEAMERAVTLSRLEWLDVADVSTDLDPDLAPIPCYGAELQMVVLNMIVNASHAIAQASGPGGPRGWIRVRTRKHGLVTEIQVADGSTEIPERTHASMFDAENDWDDGPGPWLAMAQDVVRKHGGTLAVERIHAGGTAFTMLLPSV